MSYRTIALNDLTDLVPNILKVFGTGDKIWYRGLASHDFDLEPSAYRSPLFRQNSKAVEDNTVLEARAFMGHLRGTERLEIDINWFSYMQHFGTATRLLDWSEDPNVALYFASRENSRLRGTRSMVPCMWAVKPRKFMQALGLLVKNTNWPAGMSTTSKALLDSFFSNKMPTNSQFIHRFEQTSPGLLDRIYVPFVSSFVNERAQAQESCFIRFPLLNGEPSLEYESHRLNQFVLKTSSLADCFVKFIFLKPIALREQLKAVFNSEESKNFPEAQALAEKINRNNFYP